MSPFLLTVALVACVASADPSIMLVPGAGYEYAAYASLRAHVAAATPSMSAELCVGHAADGSAALLSLAASAPSRCGAGLVLLGAVPTDAELAAVADRRVLVVAGTRDGVARLSHFAAARHRSARRGQQQQRQQQMEHRFAVVLGAAHHSFAGGAPTALTASLDLRPAAKAAEVHAAVAGLVADFLGEGRVGAALEEGEALAASVAAPIVAALKLEGSAALGVEVCNSDFPTNPSCNYPMYVREI